MRSVLLALACVVAGCGSAPEPAAPDRGAEASADGESTPDYEAALRAAEAERRAGGAAPGRRDPRFAPLDKERLQAMLEFLPGWKLEFSDHFAMMHQLEAAVAAGLLEAAEQRTAAAFRNDPRASEIVTPLLRCVAARETYLAQGGSGESPGVYLEDRNEIVLLADPQSAEDAAAILGDAVDRWFKATSPREIEKRLRFLQKWADRRRSGR